MVHITIGTHIEEMMMVGWMGGSSRSSTEVVVDGEATDGAVHDEEATQYVIMHQHTGEEKEGKHQIRQ